MDIQQLIREASETMLSSGEVMPIIPNIHVGTAMNPAIRGIMNSSFTAFVNCNNLPRAISDSNTHITNHGACIQTGKPKCPAKRIAPSTVAISAKTIHPASNIKTQATKSDMRPAFRLASDCIVTFTFQSFLIPIRVC